MTSEVFPYDRLEPKEILVDIDGPRLFSIESTAGRLLLAYQTDEDDEHSAYLVVPTDARIMAELRGGRRTVLDALLQPWTWRVRTTPDGQIIAITSVDTSEIRAEQLPKPGLYLHRKAEPLPRLEFAAEGPTHPRAP